MSLHDAARAARGGEPFGLNRQLNRAVQSQSQVRPANATERLTPKPPLCQECAKTGWHSPTIRGQSGPKPAAELGIPRRCGTARNVVDARARIYTPAVGGSIPSAPTKSGDEHNLADVLSRGQDAMRFRRVGERHSRVHHRCCGAVGKCL